VKPFANIPLHQIELVVFDVDGTLYPLQTMRKAMRNKLIRFYAFRPHKWKEVRILKQFRAQRKQWVGTAMDNLAEQQFEIVGLPLDISPKQVQEIVHDWMFERPLPLLKAIHHGEARTLIEELHTIGIHTAAFSDYPSEGKLQAMNIEVEQAVDATHTAINALKPHPKGLVWLCNYFQKKPENTLFIGDLDELDGECAKNAGVHYLRVPEKKGFGNQFYTNLTQAFRTTHGTT